MDRVGAYELLEELAEAGTGRLHLARRRADEDAEPVVLKLLHDRFRRNSFYTATLFSEAPRARRFHHPVSIGIHDVDDVDGWLFVVMERASGPSWKAIRDRARMAGRRFSTEAVLWMGRQVAGMLDSAHRHPWAEGETEGLVVGQLAPQGIFLNRAGEVRVTGVGLGRSRACLPPTRGRLPYRAPELFVREPIRPGTDVYGLGIVLYDALNGAESFQRDSVAEVKAAVLDETLPPLDHVDAEVDELVRAMTDKDPDERPDDLEAVEATLARACSRDGSLLSAEWAEHVRVLFPELFEGAARGSASPRRVPRVSVPYSQTSTRRTPPRGQPAPPPAVEPPPAPAREAPPEPASSPSPRPAVAGSRSSTYDIDDLAEILATGNLRPPREASAPTESRAEGSPFRGAGGARALAGLDDRTESFDVDSVVDAIMAGSGTAITPAPRPGAPEPDAEPGLQEPAPRWSAEVLPNGAFDAGHEGSEASLDLDSDDLAPDVVPAPRSIPSGDLHAPVEASDARPLEGSPAPSPTGRGPEPPTVPPDDTDDLRAELQPGAVIQDRYRILEELGRGGMSIVYRAEHTLLLKEVALKLLRPELSTLGSVVERFQREARSVCRLDDPNIVRVTDFGRTADGMLYLVMELITGQSLSSVIRDSGPLPLRQAISLVDQILAGLEQAHRFEIVHRDLKPENIMLVQRDGGRQVKILDFGIAKLGGGDEESKSITQAGTVFGTPRYMSPEQAAGEPVDHRTDLYTVGVILYQLLTGRVPFQGDTTVQLLAKVLTQDPPPMQFEAPHDGARAQIEAVTLKALSKKPEDRFESARAFRESLDGCLLF